MRRGETFDAAKATPNISSFTVGGGVAGLLTTAVFVAIALIGLPSARAFLVASVALGAVVALVLRVAHR